MKFRAGQYGLLVGVGTMLLAVSLLVGSVALKLQAPRGAALPVYGRIADFTLTNQDARAISLADLHGRVWVADIIFTRCAGPCLKMTRQMKELAQALGTDSHAALVTLTTDADYDTPPILRSYAGRFGADLSHWMFLTGTKQQIAALAIDSLKLTAVEKKPEERQTPEDLFIHSTLFVIVDKQAQLRGVFETTGEGTDSQAVKEQILAAVRKLEREG